MVHFRQIIAVGLVINFVSHVQGSECCDTIVVQGGGGAKARQPTIFSTYTTEPDLVNGHRHYTSQDGSMAIAFNKDHKEWKIQPVTRRQCQKSIRQIHGIRVALNPSRGNTICSAQDIQKVGGSKGEKMSN